MANIEEPVSNLEQFPNPPGTGAPGTRAAMTFIMAAVTLDFLAFGIIAPVLPDLIKQFEGGSIARASDMMGYFGLIWNLMQFVCLPVLGALSDRFGRRPVILISCLGLGLDYIFMAVAPTLKWLFVGRLISGITASNVSTAYAYIADISAPADRAKRFGMLGAAFGVGFIVGPAVGGLLGQYHLRAPFWAAAALSLANFFYGLLVLPESLAKEKRAKSAWRLANPVGSLKLLRSHPELASLSVVVTLFYLAHQSLPSVWALYTEYRYGWNPRSIGMSLAVVGGCAAVVSGGLVGPYVKRFGERFSVASGLFYGFLGFAGFGLAWGGSVAVAVI